MKLTDIMFNLDFIAAQTGAEIECGGNVFEYTSGHSDSITSRITLTSSPVALQTGGTPYVWYRKASDANADMEKMAVAVGATEIDMPENDTDYCLMYRKAVEGKNLTISSQFIPDTVHAVLTVALYSGDSCDVESATKAGEITIDIPRLQLSGAMDLSMTATGACQTPLEGNALASGCTGCDGKAVYATITQYISGKKWYDNFQKLVSAIPSEFVVGAQVTTAKQLEAYAVGGSMAAKKVTQDANLKWSTAGTECTAEVSVTAEGGLTTTAALTAGKLIKINVVYSDNGEAKLEGVASKQL